MGQYGPEEWWYPDGNPAANVTATVFDETQSTFASIFSDPGLTVPLGNPTTTDGAGLLTFYAADGDYWIFVGESSVGDSVLTTIGPAPGPGVDSVNGQTGVVVLVASDVGADPAGSAAAAAAASQPLATIDAKGDLYAGSANNTTIRRSVGADGDVLTADSGDPTGMTWAAAAPGGVTSVNGQVGIVVLSASDVGADAAGAAAAAAAASQPLATIDAKGDLYAGSANNATIRRSVGANGTVLTADSSDPTGIVWAVPASAPVTSVNGQTGVVVLSAANVGADPAGSAAAAQAASQPLDADLTAISGLTPSQADTMQFVSGAWANRTPTQARTLLGLGNAATLDVGTTAGTVAAGDDTRITGAQQRSTVTTKGDIYVATASATTTRKGVGADGTVLTASAADPTGVIWSVPAAAPVTSVNGQVGVVVLAAGDVGADVAGAAAAAQAASQPVDADLTTIAGLTPTNGDTMQYVSGAWANQAPAAARTTLGLGGAAVLNVGTTAGTVAAGDDTRITGAQQRSALTTKGDLYAATASATTTRIGVGADGTVLTANSAMATGLEWVTPTADAVTSVNGQTGIVVLNAASVGADVAGAAAAAQAASQPLDADLTTIAGLTPTNGDTLQYVSGAWLNQAASAARTTLGLGGAAVLNVGTTAGTVAAGDDSRIVNAVLKTQINAKGDLFAGSADDTVTIVSVGTDGHFLTANSAAAGGVSWAAAATKYSTGIHSSGTSIVITHNIGSQFCTNAVFVTSTGEQVYPEVTATSTTQMTFVFAVSQTSNTLTFVVVGAP